MLGELMNIDSLIYITSVLTKCQPTLYASRLVYSSLLCKAFSQCWLT